MSAIRLHTPSRLRAALAGALFFAAAALSAATGGFFATLSADQQSAAGLTALSTEERTLLDELVGMELAVVRQNGPGEITGTFLSRRTETELRFAGLERLTLTQKARLNEYVGAALASHPKPRERPRLKDDDVINPASKPQIHGSLSLSVGSGGGGRNFWGSSLWLDYFDPATGLGLSVGLSNFSGKGFYGYGYGPDYYGSGYYGSGYDGALPYYYDTAYRGPFRGDFSSGEGQSFRAFSPDLAAGWSGRRRR